MSTLRDIVAQVEKQRLKTVKSVVAQQVLFGNRRSRISTHAMLSQSRLDPNHKTLRKIIRYIVAVPFLSFARVFTYALSS